MKGSVKLGFPDHSETIVKLIFKMLITKEVCEWFRATGRTEGALLSR